jgi:thiaminase
VEGQVVVEVLTFVEGVRKELQPVSARILSHPYLQALDAGRIGRERLQLFATQQSRIIESDLRSVALMVARASSERSRGFFIELLEGERAALQGLRSFAAAIGMAPPTLAAGEPLPGAFAYSAFVAWLSLYASEAEFVGAFLINLPVWGANCGRMAEALRREYRLA